MIKPPSFLAIGWILNHFGKNITAAQRKLKTYISEGVDPLSPWQNLKAQCLLGNEQFIATLKRHLLKNQETTEFPKQQRMFNRPPFKNLVPAKQPHSQDRAP